MTSTSPLHSLNREYRPIPFYPLFMAIFPIISLLGHNIEEIPIQAANRSLAVAIGFALLTFGGMLAIMRNAQKAALGAAWLIFLSMNYGRVHQAVFGAQIFGIVWGRHLFLAPLWGLLLLTGIFLIYKKRKSMSSITPILNAISVFLLIVPTYQIAENAFQTWQASQGTKTTSSSNQVSATTLPDVYIIILDSHLRADVLQESFGYDNQPFIDELTRLGFYVAPCSMSNYAYTPLSISSLLNMNYLDQLGSFDPNSQDRTLLFELVRHNTVRRNLEAMGYQSIAMVSYQPLAWNDSDGYIATDPDSISAQTGNNELTQFERLIAKTTILKILLDRKPTGMADDGIPQNYPYADHVRQQYYILRKLQEVTMLRGPKLVFVHINIPHPPYVFNADGSLIQDPPELPWIVPLANEKYQVLYPGQVHYIDQQIIPLLRQILRQSHPAPIIIVQGDHGADSANRLAILNAYYVPEATRQLLYPNITPVNSFRIIFNSVFGTNYELLEDHSFLSSQQSLYQFEIYPETMPACKK
jgi:hypothetical protein